MTTLAILTCFVLCRLLYALADVIDNLVPHVREHFAPRGITSLDRGHIDTQPMFEISCHTPVEHYSMTA